VYDNILKLICFDSVLQQLCGRRQYLKGMNGSCAVEIVGKKDSRVADVGSDVVYNRILPEMSFAQSGDPRFVDAKPHAGGYLRRHEELSSADWTKWDAMHSEMRATYHS
jgi:hypothetical protein